MGMCRFNTISRPAWLMLVILYYTSNIHIHVLYSSPNWTNLTPFEFLWQLKATTDSLSCLEGKGEVRGVPLQHDTSPLDVTRFYTLNLSWLNLINHFNSHHRNCWRIKLQFNSWTFSILTVFGNDIWPNYKKWGFCGGCCQQLPAGNAEYRG